MEHNTLKIKKLNHAFLHIECEPCIHNELSDHFKFRPAGYQFVPSYRNKLWDGYIRLYDTQKGVLPYGLFHYITDFTKSRQYDLEIQHNNYYGIPDSKEIVDGDMLRKIPVTSKGKAIAPYDYQFNAVEHCLENKNALIISPTASGKSLIIYMLIRYYLANADKDILLVVPTTSLVQQMNSDFGDYSEFDESFDGSDMCHLIYSGQDKKSNKKITITTWQSIYKLHTPWFERYGMAIVDEAHTASAKSISSIMGKLKECDYRFGTTGTIKNDKDAKVHRLQLEGHFGPIFQVTTTKKLMDDNKLAKLDIKMILMKYDEETRAPLKKADYQVEVDFIVQNEKRNNFIKNLAIDQTGNTLVLFQYVKKHGIPLYDMIKEAAHERRKIFFVSGSTPVDEREAIRKITETQKNAIIVASYGVFSTGINIKNIHNIIAASPSKSEIKVLQSIGRGLRISDNGSVTTLYDIADDLHWKNRKNYTLKHAGERIKIYSQQEFKYMIYEVNL